MSQAQLNAGNFLQESFSRVGPVFVPLVILSLPAAVLQLVGAFLPSPFSNILSIVANLLITPLLGGAAIYIISRHLKDQQTELSEAIQRATEKAGNLILAYFLYFVSVVVGLLLLIIPGLYLAVRLVFVLYAVMLQDASGTEALGIAWRLTQGRWWSIFWCLLLAGLLLIVLPIIVVTFVSMPFGNVFISQLLGTAVGLVVGPIFGIYGFLVYKTVRQMDKGDNINRALT
ncbi:MAG: hypothetical protein AAGE59_21360 [Cyanobacteria bacterium P01_F01_bin.86]